MCEFSKSTEQYQKAYFPRISPDFGIRGIALKGTFVTDQMQHVTDGVKQSMPANCMSGILQGSVLGLLLFTIYTSPVSYLVLAHNLRHHQYANDTQLHMAV